MALQTQVRPFRAMGGPCEIRVQAPPSMVRKACDAAIAEVQRLEQKYSRYREDSLLSRINAAAGGPRIAVDEETAALLDFASRAHAQSDGLFDPSSGILRQIWDFKLARVPTEQERAAVLARIGWSRLSWRRPELGLPAGMELDFGGFVKEYAADAAVAALRACGVVHGLVNLGGDISLVGPQHDGSAWQLGVRHPRRPGAAIAQLPLRRGALSSSGDYERYFVLDGRRYCHILNPRTGLPAQGFASVSVVAEQCLVAGAMSTVAMLMPPAAALAWLRQSGLPFLCVDAQGGILQGGPGPAAAAASRGAC